MRIAVDGVPLLGARTGIGRYVSHLVDGLASDRDLSVRATAFTLRGGARPADLPAAVAWCHRTVPAGPLQQWWTRFDQPPADALSGSVGIYHGTNFVLPPLRRAAGALTVHDLAFLRYPHLVDSASLRYRSLVPRGIARADVVFVPTAAIAGELQDAYPVDPARLVVTPLGVDAGWTAARPASTASLARLKLPAEYVLAVGTLEPRKGMDLLLDAYRLLTGRGARVPPLVLVGPAGWGSAPDLAGLSPAEVVLPGYVGADVLPGLVAAASLFVFPSRYEGFGLPPLEALAAGTPVVATDIETSREVLGGHARYVPTGDAAALAEAINDALAHPAGEGERAAGRRHAAGWTWERCVRATVAGYRQAVGG